MFLRRYRWLALVIGLAPLMLAAPAVANTDGDTTVLFFEIPDVASDTNPCTGELVEVAGTVRIQITETVNPDGSEHVTLRYRDLYTNEEWISAGFSRTEFDEIADVYWFNVKVWWTQVDGGSRWDSAYSGFVELDSDNNFATGLLTLVGARCIAP